MDVLVAQVRAENGWITLSGEVEWDYQRQSAKDAVRSLLGVVGVSDDISVKPQASMSAVKSEIEAALKRRTFGRRLRAVGVSLEDRQDLLGHKSGRMTTHYSAAEVGNLWAAVNRIATLRESPE